VFFLKKLFRDYEVFCEVLVFLPPHRIYLCLFCSKFNGMGKSVLFGSADIKQIISFMGHYVA